MDKKWYVVNTYSGHEKKVQEKLLMRASSMNMEDYIFRIMVPTEDVEEKKNDKQGTGGPLFCGGLCEQKL